MEKPRRRLNRKNILNLAVTIIYIASLTGVILFLCESTEAIYQTWKDIGAAKALLCFVIFMFTVQRVRLINWQSLIVTVLYWILAIWYLCTFKYGADIETKDRIMAFVIWIMLLIIVDMIVYRKYNKLNDFNGVSLFFYAVMAVSMIMYRHQRTDPIALAGPFMLLYFIPIPYKEWNRIIRQFMGAWFVSFMYIMIKSFIVNPYSEAISNTYGRYYGCFVNIGAFGVFIGCVFIVAVYALFYYKKKFGRRSIGYIASCIWLIAVTGAVWIIGTRTMLLGVICGLVFMYLFLREDMSRRAMMKRYLTVVITLVACCVGLMILMLVAKQIDVRELRDSSLLAFIREPLAFIVEKLQFVSVGEDLLIEGYFDGHPILRFLDQLSSGRIQIAMEYIKQFNMYGNESISITVGNYVAYNAHNQYIQVLYEYGLFGGTAFIVWLIYNTVYSVYQSRKNRKDNRYMLLVMWMPMILGLLMGERVNFYYPALMMTMLVIYPNMVNSTKKQTKEKRYE